MSTRFAVYHIDPDGAGRRMNGPTVWSQPALQEIVYFRRVEPRQIGFFRRARRHAGDAAAPEGARGEKPAVGGDVEELQRDRWARQRPRLTAHGHRE